MNTNDKQLFDEFLPQSGKQWIEKVLKDLKGKAIESLDWSPEPGIALKPFYRKEDMKPSPSHALPSVTGEWEIGEIVEVASGAMGPKNANKDLLRILEHGVFSPELILDQVISKKEFAILFKDVKSQMIRPLFSGLYPESMPGKVLKSYFSILKGQSLDPRSCPGALSLDPLGFFVETGEFYEDLDSDIKEIGSAIEFAENKLPEFSIVNIRLQFIHKQKAGASREIAIALATGSEYLAKLTQLEIDPQRAAKRIRFTFSIGTEFFPEIAKLRAFKILWLNVQKVYGIKEPELPYIHCQTSNLIIADNPYSHMILNTLSSLAAVMGGADGLTVVPPEGLKSSEHDFAGRMARNTQHILKLESHLGKVMDPLAGSYYTETFTSKLAELAWQKFQKIEAAGGLLDFMETKS